ncbi:MAG: hypothetical protein WD941_04600 [Opitutus sp.]
MTATVQSLLPSVTRWVLECESIKSAVLFGSSVRSDNGASTIDQWSDIDLHVVANKPRDMERIDWGRALPGVQFCMQATRAATGGVRKVTAVFTIGQVDMIVVPEQALRLGFFALRCGLNRHVRFLDVAFNEMATCLHSGYTFIKGEENVGHIYARVASLPGVRLQDTELISMANVALCELLWILQKLKRGEVVAGQHALHLRLVDSNLRFWREIRLRRGLPVPSFGLAPRLEVLKTPLDRKLISISATATPNELQEAAIQCLEGLRIMMAELVPGWSIPPLMAQVLESHFEPPLKPGS